MKITPDNLSRLKEAAKILSGLPFPVAVDTFFPKPIVHLFLEREEFEENFPEYRSEPGYRSTLLIVEQDGVNFLYCELRESDHD